MAKGKNEKIDERLHSLTLRERNLKKISKRRLRINKQLNIIYYTIIRIIDDSKPSNNIREYRGIRMDLNN
jgi:hypothetical protein